MKTLLIALASALSFASVAAAQPPFDAKAQQTVTKLRVFCQACHAVGNLRFLRSEDDQQVWNYLFTNRAPNSQKLWSENIIEVLSWPSDVPPPFDQPMDPGNGRDWMPKGAKRLTLADDRIDGQSTRRFMVDTMKPTRPFESPWEPSE